MNCESGSYLFIILNGCGSSPLSFSGWMGELDEYSLRGDCAVKSGLKWVANSWVNVDPDHQQQARYQRVVAQRHQAKSGVEEHYQPLTHSDLHQDL